MVAEDGLATAWVRNGLASDGRLRVFLRGNGVTPGCDRDQGIPRHTCVESAKRMLTFVRMESSVPVLIEITVG